MGDNSFLRDFRARMFSSRRAMLRSMILRVSSNASPVDHKVLVSSGENKFDFRSAFLKLNWEKEDTSRHVVCLTPVELDETSAFLSA